MKIRVKEKEEKNEKVIEGVKEKGEGEGEVLEGNRFAAVL